MTTREIIGKQVVSMADGAKVGEVKDVLIDASQYLAAALVVHGERQSFHLPWSNVKGFGKDAITIEDTSCMEPAAKRFDPLRSYKDIEGVDVVDGTGLAIGSLHEMLFDDAGKIKTIDARSGGVFGIGAKDDSVMIDEVRSFGAKLITIERANPT